MKMKYLDWEGWDRDESSSLICIAVNKGDSIKLSEDDVCSLYGLTAHDDDGETQTYMYIDSLEGMKKLNKLNEGDICNLYGYDILTNEMESYEQFKAVFDRFSFNQLWHLNNTSFNLVADKHLDKNKSSVDELIKLTDRFIVCEICAIGDLEEDEDW